MDDAASLRPFIAAGRPVFFARPVNGGPGERRRGAAPVRERGASRRRVGGLSRVRALCSVRRARRRPQKRVTFPSIVACLSSAPGRLTHRPPHCARLFPSRAAFFVRARPCPSVPVIPGALPRPSPVGRRSRSRAQCRAPPFALDESARSVTTFDIAKERPAAPGGEPRAHLPPFVRTMWKSVKETCRENGLIGCKSPHSNWRFPK